VQEPAQRPSEHVLGVGLEVRAGLAQAALDVGRLRGLELERGGAQEAAQQRVGGVIRDPVQRRAQRAPPAPGDRALPAQLLGDLGRVEARQPAHGGQDLPQGPLELDPPALALGQVEARLLAQGVELEQVELPEGGPAASWAARRRPDSSPAPGWESPEAATSV
jgi:hypothetical protein